MVPFLEGFQCLGEPRISRVSGPEPLISTGPDWWREAAEINIFQRCHFTFCFSAEELAFEKWKRSSPTPSHGCLFPWVTVLIVNAACPCAASGPRAPRWDWPAGGTAEVWVFGAPVGVPRGGPHGRFENTEDWTSRSWDASLTHWWVIAVTKTGSFKWFLDGKLFVELFQT